jgi:hypothetical protein
MSVRDWGETGRGLIGFIVRWDGRGERVLGFGIGDLVAGGRKSRQADSIVSAMTTEEEKHK